MTLKVTGLKKLNLKFKTARQQVTPIIKEATKKAAELIATEAQANAPELTGLLESSIEVKEVSSAPDVNTYMVNFWAVNPKTGEEYGVLMHESFYNLGAQSLKKQAENGHIVGRKFLERALADNADEAKQIIKEATLKKIRGIFK